MSNRSRIGVLVALVAVAVVAFVLLKGGTSEKVKVKSPTGVTATTPAFPVVAASLKVTSAGPVGGVRTISVHSGDRLVIRVKSVNVTGEVHFHGFDVHRDLTPGSTAVFDISSKETKDPKVHGTLDIELEETATLIARVQVSP